MYKIKEGLWVHERKEVPFLYLPNGDRLTFFSLLGYKRRGARSRDGGTPELKFLLPLDFLLSNPNKLH